VGSLQAAAVLRLLLGVGDAAGRFVAVDVKDGTSRTLRFDNDPACPACGTHRTARGQRDEDVAVDGIDDEDAACAIDGRRSCPVVASHPSSEGES
jgi:hypothetical protein